MQKEGDWQVVFRGETLSYLFVHPDVLAEMDSFNGDTFVLTAKGVSRYFPTFPDETLLRNEVGLTPFKAKTLGLSQGDSVTVQPSETVEYGTKVSFALASNEAPTAATNANANEPAVALLGQEDALKLLLPHFEDAFAPVCEGELFSIDGVVFEVKECAPNPCIIAPQTGVFVVNASSGKSYMMLK